MIADAPIFMVLGNHDLSLFSDKNVMEIIERFMSLKEHSNLYPLSDSFAHSGEININGITLLNESYKSKNMFGKNGEILSTKLASISNGINKDNYNISLIHDPLSVYYAYKHDSKSLDGLDLVTSGHLHVGYLPVKDLFGERVDKLEYVEYFRDFKPFVKVPLVGGCYNFVSTCIIVNEGVRRFNGYIPDFISTTPLYSYITLSPEKEKKLIR